VAQDNREEALQGFQWETINLSEGSEDLRIFTTPSVFVGMANTYADHQLGNRSKYILEGQRTSVKNVDPDFMCPWGANLNIFDL